VEAVEVVERSMMPEGLANAMTVQDFRDLVRYLMAHPFLTEWQVSQPQDQPGAPTEAATPAGKARSAWSRHSLGVSGRLDLPRPPTAAGYAYATARFAAAAPLKTRLLLAAGQPLRVWLDGREVYAGTPGDGLQPDQAGVDVELTKGEHRLLVEVKFAGARAALYARFHDPDRKLTYPEPPAPK
jgi:hypothetical protein